MVKKKIKILSLLLLSSLLLISGCNSNSDSATEKQEEIISKLVSYKDSDYYTNWQEDNFTYINLEGSTATVDGDDGAVVKDNQILIRTTGTYVVKGTLDDGQIVVNAEDSGNVRLILNGAAINSSTSSPIYVKQADKTIISLEKDTENTLSDATKYIYESDSTDEPSATIYSKDDLTINGSGSLTVKGNYNDAVKSNDNLKITGGTINVTSADDGIIGRDLLAIKDATIKVIAGGDGLKASNDEDKSKGNIALESGKFTIKAEGDGIQAEKTVAVSDGKYSITAGGGSPETITNSDGGMGGDMGGGGPPNLNPEDIKSYVDTLLKGIDISDKLKEELEDAENMEDVQTILQDNPDVQKQIQENGNMGGPVMSGDNDRSTEGTTDKQQNMNSQNPPQNVSESSAEQSTETTEEETVSTKGIKAGTSLYITGGTLKIDSLDDAVHSNQNVTISDGTINISTGDDGIHGDSDVMLNGGEVSIDKSLEGIEGINITIANGTYHVVAEDDGINANGGSDELGMPGEGGNMAPPETNDTSATEENQDTTTRTENKGTNKTIENESENQEEEESTDDGLLLIKGGYLFVNANGDGLDSNTSAKMTGGTAIVYGPTNGGNGSLDYDNSFIVEGGILVASGSSGMAQGISEESSQNAIMMTYSESQEPNTTVHVTDKKGGEIIAIAPEKQFQTIVISTPDLELDQTYTFNSGGVLTGENINGFYQNASYEEGPLSVGFKLSNVMTYLNEDGVTEGNSHEMMNGSPPGRNDMGRTGSFEPGQNSEQTSQKEEE
ncbi:carbohydrate-binding domain-containing protein [Priestia filamentosa]|uniref:carbohydrate-binding domain-containing protein n=1 Tax=Priestia filamentosa TaxID=1402861 RepID=UPI00397A1F94